ncbi:protein asteroid homolog 1 [Pungitius pungitius]|uniref:protein asteroid homolog 1 n=1 Tax=Pungitius pungitius TaxID=134920 RepID=UPI002E0ED783
MGVHGLTTLLENNPGVYRQDVRCRGRRLVIDGCNLLYKLYFDSGLDQNRGGEYASFEVLIEKFIRALRACSIAPYVVLDGGTDPTDKKLKEVTRRAQDRIGKANRAALEGGREDILPPLARVVLLQTLTRLEVPLAQCYGEADREVAALAKEWRCPVLSQDSDFYVFDLPDGMLPLSHFRWQEVQQSDTQRGSFIRCWSYKASSFGIVFGLQEQMLPAFAALAGNDYVKLEGTERAWLGPQGGGVTSHLERLLRWLRGFRRPGEALEAALGQMGDLSVDRRAELRKSLYLGMGEYQIPSSSLTKFFLHRTPPAPPEEQDWGMVPQWTRLPLSEGRLSPGVLDVLLLKRKSLCCLVDRGDSPSAHLASRPLRQVMYGLLLGNGKEVQERDREGLQLKFIRVETVTKSSRGLVLPSLDQVEPTKRLQVLLEALQVSEDPLSLLPPPLRLPVAATCYWLQSAAPPPEEELLVALLLGLSAVYNGRRPGAVDNGRLREARHNVKLNVGVSHSFNQWQSCLEVSIQLNQLLGFPLLEPQISRLFEGTLVHQLVHRMKSGEKLPVESNPLTEKLYRTCQNAINQFHTQGTSETLRNAHKILERQEKTSPQRRHPVDQLTPDLQRLFLLNEDEATEARSSVRVQEELRLCDMVSVRSRYRALGWLF